VARIPAEAVDGGLELSLNPSRLVASDPIPNRRFWRTVLTKVGRNINYAQMIVYLS
jgi:hypothetical protein